jgi:hypothetical protein
LASAYYEASFPKVTLSKLPDYWLVAHNAKSSSSGD